jgi:hypothetical protein
MREHQQSSRRPDASVRVARMALGLALRPQDRYPDERRRILRFRASDFRRIPGIWGSLGFLGLLVLLYTAALIAIGYLEIWLFGW